METEAGAMPLLALEMEEGANAEECRDSRSWRQDEEMILPRTSRRNTAELTLALAQPHDLWEVIKQHSVSMARL